MLRSFPITMVALWAAITSAATAADRIVSPSDRQTLAAVLDQAAAGDRIILRPGEYPGRVIIKKTLTIEGDPVRRS